VRRGDTRAGGEALKDCKALAGTLIGGEGGS